MDDPINSKQDESPLGKRHAAPKVPSSKVVLIAGYRAKKSAVKDCTQLSKATSQEGKIRINTNQTLAIPLKEEDVPESGRRTGSQSAASFQWFVK